jgi:hypothetical protein
MPANRQNNSNFFDYGNINLFNNAVGIPSYAQQRAADVAKTQGPPNASAAPTAGTQNLLVGLCASLNKFQQQLVKQKKRQIPDQYVIEFAPPSLGASTVQRPGPQDTTTATMQTPNSASKVDPATNSVNKTGRTWPVKAGTQIIKVIDDVLRNSGYITGQQNVEVSTATDPTTGVQTQTIKAKAGAGNMTWYKISVAVKDLGYDSIIRDHAYKITFVISTYAIAQMTSQYFPDSRYRGVHKAYQYWFTGANTQILSYEQNYNNAYRLFLSGIGADAQQATRTDFRDQNRYVYMATSPDQSTGAKNYANEPGNNGASFLYDPSSLSQVKLKIIGDPAWMQQGEVALGIDAQTFNFNPYNPDGTINYDSQAIMFSVGFNTPADYDFNTGLVNVNTNNSVRQPQEYYTFTAIKCKSFFSKGRFEQEIEGKLLIEKNINGAVQNGRSTVAATSAATTNSRTNTLTQSQQVAQDLENGVNAGVGTGSTVASPQVSKISSVNDIEYDALGNPIGTGYSQPPAPQPAPAPKAPTSSGPLLDLTPITTFGGVNLQTTPTLNTNTTGQTVAPQPTNPQLINRET